MQATTPHQLELFFYVARHQGISAAARHLHYGIQQPAISEQISRLEHEIGRPLFRRRPFALTAPGRRLYEHIRPLFEGLPGLLAQLSRTGTNWRIAVADHLLNDALLDRLLDWAASADGGQLAFHHGPTTAQLQWLQEGVVDAVIAPLAAHPPAGLSSREIARRLPVLLVHRSNPLRSAEPLWRDPAHLPALIAPDPDDALPRIFGRGLRLGGISWPARVTADTRALRLRSLGRRHWVALALHSARCPASLRELPLPGFDRVPVHVIWQTADTPRLQPLLRLIHSPSRRRRS